MSKREGAGKRAGRTSRKIGEKIREGIMIFDCTVLDQEKCSEGKFLDEYMNIINHQRQAFPWNQEPVWHKRYLVRSPKGIRGLQLSLNTAYTSTIHISAHGPPKGYKGETYLMAGNSPFRLEDLKDIWSDRKENEKPLLILMSACHAGHIDLIKAFAQEGCRYCIAPKRETDWEKAALFSALFYTYLFFGPREKYEPMETRFAFEKARHRIRELTGDWKIFEYGEEPPPLRPGVVT